MSNIFAFLLEQHANLKQGIFHIFDTCYISGCL